jgi:NADPH-dependent curcumin reductase CurA
MPATMNRQAVLKSRPAGEPSEDNFELVETPVPESDPGQFLARTLYLPLDPYMRGRMSDRASYASPAALGQPMIGGTVGQVVRSNHVGFAAGDFVLGYWGWQAGLFPFDLARTRVRAYLHVPRSITAEGNRIRTQAWKSMPH